MGMLLTAALSTQAQNLASHWPGRTAKPVDQAAKMKQVPTPLKSEANTCAYTFTNTGTNNSYMKFCVTVNGNIVSFQSPSGIEYINLGTIGEGYGICDLTNNNTYYDYSDDGASSNWNAATKVSSSATAVKISRTTSDGAFTLVQTITKGAGTTPFAKVTMALTNNSGIEKDVFLTRWADVDPYNANSTDDYDESFDSTFNAAWGYTAGNYSGSNQPGFGLMIENIGSPNVPNEYQAYDVQNPPDPCDPAATYMGYQPSVDGSVEILYVLDLKAKKIGTVNARYLAF